MVQLAKGSLKGKDFTVDEDIPKDLYDLRNAQKNTIKIYTEEDYNLRNELCSHFL